MQTLTLELPAMYGDHHVNEVRRILLGVSGIRNLYASSYLRLVELSYDPEQVTPSLMKGLLAEAGYQTAPPSDSDLPSMLDSSDQSQAEKRQTVLEMQAGETISFMQRAPVLEGDTWPCPGLGVVTTNGKET